MIVQVREWYLSRTQREQHLLFAMVAIAVPLFVWLAIVRPLTSGYQDALKEHLEAIDRHGRVLALADAAKQRPAAPSANTGGVDLSLIVTEVAGQTGFALQGTNPSGPNAVEVTVGGAQALAITQWLRAIEQRGLVVQDLRMTPLPDGSVNMTARVARSA